MHYRTLTAPQDARQGTIYPRRTGQTGADVPRVGRSYGKPGTPWKTTQAQGVVVQGAGSRHHSRLPAGDRALAWWSVGPSSRLLAGRRALEIGPPAPTSLADAPPLPAPPQTRTPNHGISPPFNARLAHDAEVGGSEVLSVPDSAKKSLSRGGLDTVRTEVQASAAWERVSTGAGCRGRSTRSGLART